MELAFVLLCVLIGTGAIVYAGMRRPARRKTDPSSGDSGASPVPASRHDADDSGASDAGGDGGGGGGGGD